MPRNTPLQERMTSKKLEMASPIQLFDEPNEEGEEEEADDKQQKLVVEVDEPEVSVVLIEMFGIWDIYKLLRLHNVGFPLYAVSRH